VSITDVTEPHPVCEGVRIDVRFRTLADLAEKNRDGQIETDPEGNERYAWNAARASQLIESLILGLPVPPIYLVDNGPYLAVIDGVQRIGAIFRFLDDRYGLCALRTLAHLNGRRFSDLPDEMQAQLAATQIRSLEIFDGSGRNAFATIANA
jgi:hypothetical protein